MMKSDVVTLDKLTPFEAVLLKPAEHRAGRVDRALLRQRGQTLASRAVTDGTVLADRRAGASIVDTTGRTVERDRNR